MKSLGFGGYWAPQLRLARVLDDPRLFVELVGSSERVLVALGREGDVVRYGSMLARVLGASLVLTDPELVYDVLDMGEGRVTWIKPVSLANRLCNLSWMGVYGEGSYDLVVFTGIPYTTMWTMLSNIGKRAPNLRTTIVLDKLYHPLPLTPSPT